MGLGVSKPFKNRLKSCSIALGNPVVPVENKTRPGFLFLCEIASSILFFLLCRIVVTLFSSITKSTNDCSKNNYVDLLYLWLKEQ